MTKQEMIDKTRESNLTIEKKVLFYSPVLNDYIEKNTWNKFDSDWKIETPNIIIYLSKPLTSLPK